MENMYGTLASTVIESVQAVHLLQYKSADAESQTDSMFSFHDKSYALYGQYRKYQ